MKLPIQEEVLWIAGPAAHLLVLTIMLVRKRLQGLRLFATYIGLVPVDSLLLFIVKRNYSHHAYFLSYWITGYIEYVLQLCVAFELARKVLSPLKDWMRDSRRSLSISFAAGVGLAFVLAFGVGRSSPGYATLSAFDRWEVHLSVFRSLIICGVVLATYSLANRFYLQVGRHKLAVLVGLFAWSYSALAVDLSEELFGWGRTSYAVDTVQKLIYLGVLIYLASALWLPEKEHKPLPPEAMAQLAALHDSVQLDLTRLEESGR